MSDEQIPGVADDGSDRAENDPVRLFLEDLRQRQEAVWAVISHSRVVFDGQQWQEYQGEEFLASAQTCSLYVPTELNGWSVQDWVQKSEEIEHEWFDTLRASVRAVADAHCDLRVHWILPLPSELAEFVAQNTGRPRPRRYNSTAVQYTERDGVVWLTPPEVNVYDELKARRASFIAQPGIWTDEGLLIPDFLILWKGRPSQAVMIEIDSDFWHRPPSARKDEVRNQYFQSHGYAVLRFSAVDCNNPKNVVNKIGQFCTSKFGVD